MSSLGKVYCSAGYQSVANWIVALGFEITTDISEANLVAFAGGQDIDHRFYGEQKGRFTGAPTKRDEEEYRDFLIARDTGKKMVGICRGGQLLCALSGGGLIQHVENHAGSNHQISTFDKGTYRVNSLHHQMFNPYLLNKRHFDVLAWASKPLSNIYLNGNNKEAWKHPSFKETEVVRFRNTDSFAIQYHPEMMHYSREYDASQTWLGNTFLKFYNNEQL